MLREIGVETGGSNVQFAVNPKDGRLVVIEMNPRVSRSSALASKATGFPIAKVAAKCAIGYTLDEIANDITGGAMPASFEPTIDYVVTKIPRFAFERFPGSDPILTTSMKSVGEAMAIGRTFQESLQKALRSLDTGLAGLDEPPRDHATKTMRAALAHAEGRSPARRRRSAAPRLARRRYSRRQLLRSAGSSARSRTSSTPRASVRANGVPQEAGALRALKAMGFSDQRLAKLAGQTETRSAPGAPHAGRAAAIQAHRFLRRRIPRHHALYVFDL